MISPAHILTERLIYISNKLDGIRRMNLAISGGSSPDILFFYGLVSIEEKLTGEILICFGLMRGV